MDSKICAKFPWEDGEAIPDEDNGHAPEKRVTSEQDEVQRPPDEVLPPLDGEN